MRVHRRLLVVFTATALLLPATAAGHNLTPTIALPAGTPVEDAGFAVQFTGNATSLSSTNRLIGVIRPAGGTPCAPTPTTDTGYEFASASVDAAPFSVASTYVAPRPGDYLICAWIRNGYDDDYGPPASLTISVRRATLRITANAPGSVRPNAPFTVKVDYQAEVQRYLTVVVAHASSCSVSSDALRAIAPSTVVVDHEQVSGASSITPGAVRLAKAGTYLVCAFFEESRYSSDAADYVVQAATVVVKAAAVFKTCGSVGGRRHITAVRARNASCISAKGVARRWGQRRTAPRRLGAYRCSARSGIVTCTAGGAQVKFRFGRRR